MKHIHRIRSTRLVSNRVLEPQHDSFLQESQLTERSGATGATLAGHVPLSRRWGTSLRALLLLVAISALLATTPAHSQTTPTGFTVSNYATNLPGSGGVTNMAIDTATRTIYYAEANSNSGTAFVPLFKLAPNRTFTTVTTQMGLFGFNPYIATDLEFFEGGVYFVSDSGNAVRIDVTTGTVTKLATLFGSGDESGCVIRNGVLYATDGTGTTNAVKSLNLTTLAQTTLASAIPSLSSTLEYNAIRDSYYFMDVGGGRLMKMTPAGAVSPVANLGTSAYNFAIEPSGAAAYVRANGSTTVLRVDLTTGVVTTFVTGLATTSLTDLVMGPSSTGTTWSLYIGDGSRIVEVAGFAITQPPIADAGPDQTVNEGVFVTLDGTRSRDTNNPPKPLTYQWRQTDGVQVTLLNPSTVSPSFTAPSVPLEGAVLKFELSVSNGVTTPATDIVIVNVVNVNTPPTANAGSDQTVPENSLVTLSGSGSDPDGDPLIPTWTQTGSPTVVLSDTNTATPSFIAPPVSSAQGTIDLTFCLTVNDGFISSGPSCVTVHVFNTNAPPIANAGIDQSVNELDLVTLDGTHSSDPNGDTLTYSWAQVGNPPIVALSGADTATPSFTTPELLIGGVPDGTTLTFQLTVSDGELSSTGIVNVRVRNVNHPPLVDAGTDQTVPERSQVTLHGENSGDPDGDTLTYAWVQTGGTPQVELTDATAAMASFTAPDVGVNGDVLTFRLTVNDGYGGVISDEVVVHVTYVNRPPTANTGTDQTVAEGSVVALVGTGSDPDGNALSFAWSHVSGPAVSLSDPAASNPTFTAPMVTRAEADVVLRLTVSDGYGGSASDDVTIHIANINHPPIAKAPANLSVPEGSPVSLIGQGVDEDTEEQSQLIYSWQQIAPVQGPSYSDSSLDFTAPFVTAGGDPNATLTLTFRLTVIDPNGAEASDDVDVVVTNVEHAPTANAGGLVTANEGASVSLNGLASSDPDGDTLTYTWIQTDGPNVTLHDANTATPYFTAPFVNTAGATLKFNLTVNDGYDGSSSDTATVRVLNINDPPTVTNARPSIGMLWPPDHRLVPVSILGIVDPDNNATITITGVTQDEPTNGLGDGDTPIDAIINADGTVLLRAERSGKGDGRVYRISFTASDFEGSASGVVKVVVPHSKKTDAAIDSGGVFQSTQ